MKRGWILALGMCAMTISYGIWGFRLQAEVSQLQQQLRDEHAAAQVALEAAKKSSAEQLTEEKRAEQEKLESDEIKDLTSVYQSFLFDYKKQSALRQGSWMELAEETKSDKAASDAHLRELDSKVVVTLKAKKFQSDLLDIVRLNSKSLDYQGAFLLSNVAEKPEDTKAYEELANRSSRDCVSLLHAFISEYHVKSDEDV
jgi:hypothetical protein